MPFVFPTSYQQTPVYVCACLRVYIPCCLTGVPAITRTMHCSHYYPTRLRDANDRVLRWTKFFMLVRICAIRLLRFPFLQHTARCHLSSTFPFALARKPGERM